MSEPFIFCDGLVKIYQVAELEVVALQGLHLAVEQGELLGIVGASGSGKSTLMNILGGLDRPSAGQVRVGEHNLLKASNRVLNRYRREQVGFVWQQSARNLVPYLNALENVTLPMTLSGSGANKRVRALELLDLVGLAERADHYLPELSGGEQQRVSIAVALANDPVLLLGDELTGEVDSTTAQIIYDLLRRINSELGLTMLLVSHDPNVAHHVDRVVAIRDGMLASETRRQSQPVNGDGVVELDAAPTFEELAVIDRAGRLQIPKDFIEQYGFGSRARLEPMADGLLIRPAEQMKARVVTNGDAAEVVAEEAQVEKPRGLLSRLRRK